jgi:hypothetical protein
MERRPNTRTKTSALSPVDGQVFLALLLSLVTSIVFDTFLSHLYRMSHTTQSYQIPDYTAYDQILSAFKRLVPVPTA